MVRCIGIKTVQKSNNLGQKTLLSIFQPNSPKRYFLGSVFTLISHPSCVNPNCGPGQYIQQQKTLKAKKAEYQTIKYYKVPAAHGYCLASLEGRGDQICRGAAVIGGGFFLGRQIVDYGLQITDGRTKKRGS